MRYENGVQPEFAPGPFTVRDGFVPVFEARKSPFYSVNRLPISVCMVSGAEAPRIGRALASVADWTREIVVVLNVEVNDGTAEIAERYGARIYRHPWQGFREQKNLALDYARQPWVLALDADEEVSEELGGSIIEFLNKPGGGFSGARFARKTHFLGRWITHGDWYPDRVLRLFTRGEGRWSGSVEHCRIEISGAVKNLAGDLLHYSNPTIASYVQKINYFADLFLERQLAQKARWSAPRTVVHAAWRFIRAYVFRGGFLDGYPGFFIAVSTAYATLVRYSRLYEHNHSCSSCAAPSSFPDHQHQ
ncbi:MAG: glycosyltransferase family 2 protein [Candidatus Omnitrophica bacterium]|nr:glycosyltransferase family 2 protein [Candidatus Omnitrophota bacterium]